MSAAFSASIAAVVLPEPQNGSIQWNISIRFCLDVSAIRAAEGHAASQSGNSSNFSRCTLPDGPRGNSVTNRKRFGVL
jgi:hypothetical protein